MEARDAQLRLLDSGQHRALPSTWKLDRKTRERGLVGVARAREILASTRHPDHRLPRAS